MKKISIKRAISIMLTLCILLSVFVVHASAAGDTISTATPISLGTTYSGSITATNEKDVYKFTISTSGRINVNVTAYIEYTHYYIYTSAGETVWSSEYCRWNDITQQMNKNDNVDLVSGTYYFAVAKYPGRTGNYNFKISFTSANESFKETHPGTNNSIATASSISTDTLYKGQIAINDDKDLYKFTISTSGRINVNVTAYIEYTHYYIYTSAGETVWSLEYCRWNDTTQQMNKNENVDLASGTYYFAVVKYPGRTGNYTFNIGGTASTTTYTVTYNANGGSVSPKSESVQPGKSVTLPTPTKNYTISYKTFFGDGEPDNQSVSVGCKGWSTSSSATSASYSCGSSYKPSSSTTTLYAVWNSSASAKLSTVTPTRKGYKFLGWSTKSTGSDVSYSAGASVSLTGDLKLYAVWGKDNSGNDDPNPTPTPTNNDTNFFGWLFGVVLEFFVLVYYIVTFPFWIWFEIF